MNDVALTHQLHEAADRLMARGLLQPGSSLSQRLTGTGLGQIALLKVDADRSCTVRLAAIDAPASGTLLRWHLAVYRLRRDVGAMLLNQQSWAGALKELGCGMPGIFDEQIRHLGTSVKLLANQTVKDEHCEWMRGGENAFVLNQNVLCLGMTLDRAVFNAELLEKCAKAFVLATGTGRPVGKIPWLIRYIANGRLMKDEKYSARQYALGQVPVFKSAY
jgi:ribulose-5-phosphate 4-epimerase/fuculose-1-phosphate aldolase